jgi:hypothetical protein
MESSLAVFFFALAGWIFTLGDMRIDHRRATAFGLALSGLVLSRLDHVILVLPLVGALSISLVATRGWRRSLACFLGAFSAPIALYVSLNYAFFGMLVPVSGVLKSSFPHVVNQNIDDLVAFWTGPWDGLFLTKAYRHFAAGGPALAAILYLTLVLEVRPLQGTTLVRLRGWAGRYHTFLAVVAPGVVLLALYDILFVRWLDQGHWYFPVSTLFVSMAAFSVSAPLEEWVAAWLRARLGRSGPRSARVLSGVWLAACTGSVIAVFVHFHRQLDYHRNYADFYFAEAAKVRARYGPDMPKFLELDDGIVAYSLKASTMSTGMGVDPAAADALRHGDLLTIALGDTLGASPSREELRAWAHSVAPFDDSKPYDFALDYLSADGHFAIVKAWKQ